MIAVAQKLPKRHLFLLFFAALIIRCFVFFAFVQYEGRYQQADSMDYHNCAIGLWWGTGMHMADSHEPIFWRTPGYPLYLALFYTLFPEKKTGFADWRKAHTAAIVVQIILSSLIPILLWLLAMALTNSSILALLLAWISVLHPGFVLASTYILTEGLAVVLFLLFLVFFYKQLRAVGEQNFSRLSLLSAALFLAAYTWMRPMGQFVAVVAICILFSFSRDQWKLRMRKVLWFALIFFAAIAPWYVRNHNLTGHWFFCPMSGPYLNSFCAPKIVRTVKEVPLEFAIRLLYKIATERAERARKELEGTGYVLARETICGSIAWPLIKEYPLIFIRDWTKEVLKTTFDLYSYQFVAMTNGSFRYDPLEEFLSEKLAACLYKEGVPWWIRLVSYLELIYEILLWIGLLAGAWLFMLWPLYPGHPEYRASRGVSKDSSIQFAQKLHKSLTMNGLDISQLHLLWWQVAPFIGAVLIMTGGFGYARLRLPVEGLMIILSLTWWLYRVHDTKHQSLKMIKT